MQTRRSACSLGFAHCPILCFRMAQRRAELHWSGRHHSVGNLLVQCHILSTLLLQDVPYNGGDGAARDGHIKTWRGSVSCHGLAGEAIPLPPC